MPRMRWLTGLVLAWAGCAPAVQDRVRDYNEDGVFLYKQGDFLAGRQSFDAAQARLRQALELDPHNVRALVELGLVFEDLAMPDRAVVLYERALQQDPHQPEVAQRLNQLRAKGAGRPRP